LIQIIGITVGRKTNAVKLSSVGIWLNASKPESVLNMVEYILYALGAVRIGLRVENRKVCLCWLGQTMSWLTKARIIVSLRIGINRKETSQLRWSGNDDADSFAKCDGLRKKIVA
jgi:hypothetical protein